MLDVFHTLAEVAVAITGFSSLIIIFRGSASGWSRQGYVGFAFVLGWSIGCIFLSLLPIVLVEFGMKLSAAARIGLFAAVGYMFSVSVILTYARSRSASVAGWRSAMGQGSIGFWMSVSYLVIVASAFAAGVGLFPGPMHAWNAATIVLLMAHATAELVVFVVQSTRKTGAEQ